MSNKILRKELELTLVKTIEDVLSKINSPATKKINKLTQEASKTIAKKFFKTIKLESEIKKATSKIVSKKTAVLPKKEVKAPIKKVIHK